MNKEDRRYLKWYNKIGYGMGDMGENMISALVTAFVMIYLTDTMDMKASIVGTLIMLSKIADGFTDVLFGKLIDNTNTKIGKARPWMLWAFFGNAVLLIATFSVPIGWGDTAKYIYFFITYTFLNAGFYTATNVAYASLTALITRNDNERVQLGVFRFVFALATSLVINSFTVTGVTALGGGAEGWRKIAIIYGLIGIVINLISVFSVKELPEEISAHNEQESLAVTKKITFKESFILLIHNKYFLMICAIYIFAYMQASMNGAVGAYYMPYVLGNSELLGPFSIAGAVPTIVGLVVTPVLVKKWGMYKVNLTSAVICFAFRTLGWLVGPHANLVVMLVMVALPSFFMGPIMGSLNALTAAAADWTYKKSKRHLEGSIFSCSSMGIKIGNGIGTALAGVFLDLGGYVNAATVQPQSAISMLHFLYWGFPVIAYGIAAISLFFMDVEKANAALDAL